MEPSSTNSGISSDPVAERHAEAGTPAGSDFPPAPYPGLRAFRPEEAAIFCGRAEHRLEMLDLLAGRRFLAVVGASGSGKSSLVFAGLLRDIEAGHLLGVDAGSARRVCIQPGLRPYARLAGELATQLGAELDLEPILRRGPHGLVQALDNIGDDPERALIVVVDQFEELFRFADMSPEELLREERSYADKPLLDGSDNDAQAFVNLLLRTASQSRRTIYVLLTMRSEFLVRCDQFAGLPEAISRSQFLTPRLNRRQLEQAIVVPIGHFDGSIDPALVNLILNQISSEQDQLPLMQHALARMWELHKDAEEPVELSWQDYNAVGGLAGALNKHGDDLCRILSSRHGIRPREVEAFFRTLAHHPAPNVPPVRRPIRVAQIVEESGVSADHVRTIANVFRAEGCHLLMPPMRRVKELTDDTFIDISHESLLRQWGSLKKWLETEWHQRSMAEELARSMKEWEASGSTAHSGFGTRLQRWKQAGDAVANKLYRDARPLFAKDAPANLPNWARRYQIDWAALSEFCRTSFSWKAMTGVLGKMGLGLALLSVLLVAALFWAVSERKQAQAARLLAESNAERAGEEERKASDEAEKAKISEERAKLSEQEASARAVDAINRLEEIQQSDREERERLQRVLAEAWKSNPGNPELIALLRSPELQAYVEDPNEASGSETPEALAVLGAPRSTDTGLPPAPTTEIGVGFLSTDAGPVLLTSLRSTGQRPSGSLSVWNFLEVPGGPRSVSKTGGGQLTASPDGKAVVSVSGKDRVRWFDGNAEPVTSGRCKEAITAAMPISFRDQSLVLFGTGQGSLGFWSGQEDEIPALVEAPSRGKAIVGLDYRSDQGTVLATATGGMAVVLKIEAPIGSSDSPLPLLRTLWVSEAHGPDAKRASLHPTEDKILLPVQFDRYPNILVYTTLEKGAQPHPLPLQGIARDATFSPDGSMIAGSDLDGRIYLWDFQVLQDHWMGRGNQAQVPPREPEPVILAGHTTEITHLLWAPESNYLLSTGADGLVILWQEPRLRVAGGFNSLPRLLPSHKGGVTGAAISAKGTLVATSGRDGRANVYPVRAKLRGKARVWGGPDATGIGGGEGLALFAEADLASGQYDDLFLREQPPDTKGLVYRLNPKALYVNARWDYAFTSRAFLKRTEVLVRRLNSNGRPTGETFRARPVDWGPPASSGFDFDISPGLRNALDLESGGSIQVEIRILDEGTVPQPAATPPGKVRISMKTARPFRDYAAKLAAFLEEEDYEVQVQGIRIVPLPMRTTVTYYTPYPQDEKEARRLIELLKRFDSDLPIDTTPRAIPGPSDARPGHLDLRLGGVEH